MSVHLQRENGSTDEASGVRKRMVQVFSQLGLFAVVLFVSAGTLDWPWAWIYLGVSVVILAINGLVLPRELVAERGAARENVKPWDKALTRLVLLPYVATWLVVGLDKRYAWSPELPVLLHLVALGVFALGEGLFTWAMVSNRFFSTAVRLQMERGHSVASGGPYRYVRHPGYVAFILFTLATPPALGSLWGLVPAGLVALLFVVRTALEDRTLRQELDGYQAYARQVRYRLVPGVW
jgi:protein-S-isoprenylcysteine O-methyltransferase Ste14